MRVSRINPHSNSCTLEIELSWEVVQALYEATPSLLAALGTVLRDRQEEAARRKETSTLLDAQLAHNKAKWAELAEQTEAEIRRRSNGPGSGSRQTLIRLLAAENGVTFEHLARILRVHRQQQRQVLRAAKVSLLAPVADRSRKRATQIARLHAAGLTQREIAQKVGISARAVRGYLSALKSART